jgi:hypothetical protein
VRCGAIVDDGGMQCYLDCSNDVPCPDGMECIEAAVCMWRAGP